MHDIFFVQRRTPSHDLLQTLYGKFLGELLVDVKEILQAATIAKLEDWIVVWLGLDDLLHADDIRTVNHIKENDLTA